MDFSLVSKKLEQKLACWVVDQGQVNLAKKAKTCPHNDITHRKFQTQNNFFLNLN